MKHRCRRIGDLRSANQKSKEDIQQLQSELEIANNNRRLSESQLEAQLNASRDLARLQNQLAVANQKAPAVEKRSAGTTRRKEQAEAIASLSQELRQPMSSIIGYTDLLLGESVGILGALQQKFIERIKASTERMGGLIDDMIQLNTLEVGLSDLKPEAMDLNLILDNALAYTSSQVREKKISIHLDLSKKCSGGQRGSRGPPADTHPPAPERGRRHADGWHDRHQSAEHGR